MQLCRRFRFGHVGGCEYPTPAATTKVADKTATFAELTSRTAISHSYIRIQRYSRAAIRVIPVRATFRLMSCADHFGGWLRPGSLWRFPLGRENRTGSPDAASRWGAVLSKAGTGARNECRSGASASLHAGRLKRLSRPFFSGAGTVGRTIHCQVRHSVVRNGFNSSPVPRCVIIHRQTDCSWVLKVPANTHKSRPNATR